MPLNVQRQTANEEADKGKPKREAGFPPAQTFRFFLVQLSRRGPESSGTLSRSNVPGQLQVFGPSLAARQADPEGH
jgi:hypothetical protein